MKNRVSITVEQYKQYKAQRLPDPLICDIHGIPLRALIIWKKDNGISSNWEMSVAEYFSLKDLGMSDEQVAKYKNVSKETISRWKRLNGIVYVWNRITVEQYRQYKKDRLPDKLIAEMVGTSFKTLLAWKKRNIEAIKRTVSEYLYLKDVEKLTDHEIADYWGIQYNHLSKWKTKHNLTNRRVQCAVQL